MDVKTSIFVTDAMFFETFSSKHKPTDVSGRDFCSLSYRHQGKVLIKSEGEEFLSFEDCITFIPRGLSYNTEILEDVHMSLIHFNMTGAELPQKPVVIKANGALASLFGALMQNKSDTRATFSRMAVFYEILSELEKMSNAESAGFIPQKIAEAKHIIENNFSDPYLSIESVADKLKVSTSYLRREFRIFYGMSPVKYLKEIRLNHAKKLLIGENCTVVNAAQKCGYSSACYFIQDFHKAFGESPSKYRERFSFTP